MNRDVSKTILKPLKRGAKQQANAKHRYPRLSESGSQSLHPKTTEDKLKARRAFLEACAFKAIAALKKKRLEAGRIFLQLKGTCKHGEWEEYYEKTFGRSCVSFRTAERYMKF